MTEIKKVSEAERSAVETTLLEKFGTEKPLSFGAAGNSPYSPEAVVYGPDKANERGIRVALAPVCQSHDGAGHYKGRGRWRTVYVVAPKDNGDLAVCDASDRDANEVESSGYFVRPWETHEAEQASNGMGEGANALAAALAEIGL
jgi:hypothetical protein